MCRWLVSPILMLGLIAGCSAGDEPSSKQTLGRMLIVTTSELESAAARYAVSRTRSGFLCEVLTTDAIAEAYPAESLVEAIRGQVQTFALAEPQDLQAYVLLLGDADVDRPEALERIPVSRGTDAAALSIWYGWGDGPYVDFDDDDIPDLPIGRLPFRTPEQVDTYLGRIENHEGNYATGPQNKTLTALAGEGGFGPEIDGMLELAAGWLFDEMSYDFDMSMTYASPNSSYYLPPDMWDAHYAASYKEGAVLMPFIGHTLGAVTCCEDGPPSRRGLLAFFSCSDGAFQESGDHDPHGSLAEDVLLREYGPVASLGATDLSHPYANAILPRELGHAVLDLREPTYGLVVMRAKYNMVHRLDNLRATIDGAAMPYTDEPLDELITTHLVLYNLLGDPSVATMLPPAEVRIDPPEAALSPGATVSVSGQVRGGSLGAPEDGQVSITLEVRRTTVCHELLPSDPGDPGTCANNHAASNDKVAARAQGQIEAGSFSVQLIVPADLEVDSAFIKAYAWDDQVDAIGSVAVTIQQ